MSVTSEATIKPTLPEGLPPTFAAAWEALSPAECHALLTHLKDRTSAEWLSSVLTRWGHPIGATTIKSTRRVLRQAGVLV